MNYRLQPGKLPLAEIAAFYRASGSVSGFMVPLEAKAEQTRFLLTVKPQDCEFCIEGGPATFIEVWSKPLRFSSKPFFLAGTLRLLHDDPSGMYYRLDGAGVAAVGSEIAH